MVYPVDNTFLQHHISCVFCRYRLLLLSFALIGCVLLGVCAWRTVTVKYQLNGIFLLNSLVKDFQLNKTAADLEQQFKRELVKIARIAKIDAANVGSSVDLLLAGDSGAVHWGIYSRDRGFIFNFSAGLPDFIRNFQKEYPQCQLAYSVDGNITVTRNFKRAFFRIAAGCGIGVFAGFLIAFFIAWVLVCRDRSIGSIAHFSQKYSLNILGVLPEIRNVGKISYQDLETNLSFRKAVDSLRLNVQFCRHAARRAFVIVVSGLEPRNGATTVSRLLAEALRKSSWRVLVLDKHNCNMDVSANLSRNLEELLAGKTEEYDFIIIDAPAVQSSSVPLIVSKLSDTVLLICDSRDCPGYPLQVVLWRLQRAQVNVAGCVLNRFPANKQRRDYDFYQLLFRKYNS